MTPNPLAALFSRAGIPVCFLMVALPLGMLLSFLTPPFQNPDEFAHVFRADQIARGAWRGERVDCAIAPDPVLCRTSDQVAFHIRDDAPTLGGQVDVGLLRLASLYRGLTFDPDRTVTRTMYEAARQIGFVGKPHPAAFTATAAYSPLLYLPAAAAIGAARAAGSTPLVALHLARLANLLLTIGLAAIALALCLRGARSMAVLLVLPMSLAMAASAAPDGIMLAVAALGGAILSRAMQRPSGLAWRHIGALAAVLVTLGLARPPYAALGLLVLAAPIATPLGPASSWRSRLLRLGVMLPAGVAVLGWVAAVSSVVLAIPVPHPGGRPDLHAQAAFLLDNPLELLLILYRTFVPQAYMLAYQAVGILGWLDTPLPRAVYVFALPAMALALAADGGAEDRRPGPSTIVVGLALASYGIVAVGLALGLYVSYTPVGSTLVFGLQGRYFVPPLVFCAPFMPRILSALPRAGMAATGGFLAFSLVIAVLVPLALVARFDIAPQ